MPGDTPLAQTQDDIRAAQALPDSPDRASQGSGCSRHEPAEVLLDPTSTPEQKLSAARLAFKQARRSGRRAGPQPHHAPHRQRPADQPRRRLTVAALSMATVAVTGRHLMPSAIL